MARRLARREVVERCTGDFPLVLPGASGIIRA